VHGKLFRIQGNTINVGNNVCIQRLYYGKMNNDYRRTQNISAESDSPRIQSKQLTALKPLLVGRVGTNLVQIVRFYAITAGLCYTLENRKTPPVGFSDVARREMRAMLLFKVSNAGLAEFAAINNMTIIIISRTLSSSIKNVVGGGQVERTRSRKEEQKILITITIL
jgi:hypothetical protein